MAKTKKHEMSKQELRAPDPFQAWLERVWAWLTKHRKPLILAIAAVVVGGTVIWILSTSKAGSRNAESLALKTALAPVGARLDEPTPEPADSAPAVKPVTPPGPAFKDEAARLAAADAALAAYLQQHTSGGATELVHLTEANLKLEKGDAAGALTIVQQWRSEHAGSPATPFAIELAARAHTAKGERELAAKALDELAKLVGGPFKADVLVRLGDLQNPILNGGAGDVAQAKAAYQQALAALPAPSQTAPQLGDDRGPRGEIKSKLELLD